MKYKQRMTAALFFVVLIGIMAHSLGQTGITGWLKSRYEEAKNLIYTVIEKAEQKFFFSIKDVEKYGYFKGKSDAIQDRINHALDSVQEDTALEVIAEAQALLKELVADQEVLLQEAKIELSSHDYTILKREIQGLIGVAQDELGKLKVQGSIALLLKDNITPEIVAKVNRYNVYRILDGHVRKVHDLTQQENAFLLHRIKLTNIEQQKYFNKKDITHEQTLKIGLVFSGGGLRATTLSAGYLQGLKKLGLFDMAQYTASLSGSIWAMMLLMHQGSTEKVEQYLLAASKDNTLDISSLKRAFSLSVDRLISDVVWPRVVFDQPLRSVDSLYGALLATAFFKNDPGRYHSYLADQWKKIDKGQFPFPLYTAISFVKHPENEVDQYHWIEFNPVEVVDIQEQLAVPAFAFGRKFLNGVSQDRAPGIADYAVMGVGGSAYAVNFKDLKNIVIGAVAKEGQEKQTAFSRIKNNAVLLTLKGIADITPIGGVRASPAQFNNPWFGYVDVHEWLKKKEFLTIVDAGIDINLPVPALLRKERAMDVLIICDSSGNVGKPGNVEMQKVILYAKKLGYIYKKIDVDETCTVYQDRTNSAPDIIYINYRENDRILQSPDAYIKNIVDDYNQKTFDYRKCLQKTCETFNFDYSPDIMRQIIGRSMVNVVGQKDTIMQILSDRLTYKTKQLKVSVSDK